MFYRGCGNSRTKIFALIFLLIAGAATLYGAGAQENIVEVQSDSPARGDTQAPGEGISGPSRWILETRSSITFEINGIILIITFILCAVALLLIIRGIMGIISESAAIRLDAAALVTGELMPQEKKKRMVRVKKRMGGLRLKLASYTILLVLIVDIMVSVPLYYLMIRNQRRTLIKGLWDRATVLLEGLAANAKPYLSQGNIQNMSLLPGQMVSIPEALYVTITGYNPETRIFEDQVWASNDPNIQRKIDTPELIPGYSRIIDTLTPQFRLIKDELDSLAIDRVGGFPRNIANLNQEILELADEAKNSSSPDAIMRYEEDLITLRVLENRITEALSRISSGIRSEPYYNLDDLEISQNRRYLFYKPIMLRLGSEARFLWGFVRLEVSINSILNEIAAEQRNLLRFNLLIALAAQTIGVIGALILSMFIIRPVRLLVKHVEIIRDTEDKAKLDGVDIKFKSHDEFTMLGNTINDMTHGLVKAAVAASELSIGKEFQKKFLPLELDVKGDKLSSGFEENLYFNLFGYYEGAKDVSGDYFDYQDLDGRYYAVIKCDVAGKGVPASFIMIQVATMFLNFFRRWKPNEKGMHIEDLVYQINEFIENLAFRDRFAAFTLCLYDSHTGTVRFCNAGDNLVHLYDASEKTFKIIPLPETPAAGVLSNFMVESKGGYRVQTMTLDHGDILLLYTDGIEESKRKFRNADFEEMECTEGDPGTQHINHVSGESSEELGYDRMEKIVNAVMNKKIYTLQKLHNPEGSNKDLYFDFRRSKCSVEEVIMALISVEKMFRCYYDPKATEDNFIMVDKIVDSFLKEYFNQYRNYFSFPRENPGKTQDMYYTHVMEDEQYDDLTILGIKRK